MTFSVFYLTQKDSPTFESLTGITTTPYPFWKPQARRITKHGEVGRQQGVCSNHQRRHLLDLHLHFMHYPSFINWLLGPQSPLEVSCIQTLDISRHGLSDVHAVNKLLRAIGSSLRHLKLNELYLWCGLCSLSLRMWTNF